MIKIIATLTMLIDHIGFLFFPTDYGFRIVGRISMPLFAYCIARGFYYSKTNDSLRCYFKNMLLMSFVSQYPYFIACGQGLNIGFTWLCSLLLLYIISHLNKIQMKMKLSLITAGVLIMFCVGFNILPVDYGIYGVLMPVLFYPLIAHNKKSLYDFFVVLFVSWAIYFLINDNSIAGILQLASIFSAFVLAFINKKEDNIKIPKIVFYAFYPVHLTVLLCLKEILLI